MSRLPKFDNYTLVTDKQYIRILMEIISGLLLRVGIWGRIGLSASNISSGTVHRLTHHLSTLRHLQNMNDQSSYTAQTPPGSRFYKPRMTL